MGRREGGRKRLDLRGNLGMGYAKECGTTKVIGS
jgi:hypothetical protein